MKIDHSDSGMSIKDHHNRIKLRVNIKRALVKCEIKSKNFT